MVLCIYIEAVPLFQIIMPSPGKRVAIFVLAKQRKQYVTVPLDHKIPTMNVFLCLFVCLLVFGETYIQT